MRRRSGSDLSDLDQPREEEVSFLEYGDEDNAMGDTLESAELCDAEAAVRDFGGLSECPSSSHTGQTRTSLRCNKNEGVLTPDLTALRDKLNSMGSTDKPLALSAREYHNTLPALRLALEEANSRARQARARSNRTNMSEEDFNSLARCPGQLIFAPIAEAQADSSVPISDESRISTTLAVYSEKVRPAVVLSATEKLVLVCRGTSRQGKELTKKNSKNRRNLLERFVRLKNAGSQWTPIPEENKVLEVDGGHFLKESAVLDMDAGLTIVRIEDIVKVTRARISKQSAESLVYFLWKLNRTMYNDIGKQFNFDVHSRPDIKHHQKHPHEIQSSTTQAHSSPFDKKSTVDEVQPSRANQRPFKLPSKLSASSQASDKTLAIEEVKPGSSHQRLSKLPGNISSSESSMPLEQFGTDPAGEARDLPQTTLQSVRRAAMTAAETHSATETANILGGIDVNAVTSSTEAQQGSSSPGGYGPSHVLNQSTRPRPRLPNDSDDEKRPLKRRRHE